MAAFILWVSGFGLWLVVGIPSAKSDAIAQPVSDLVGAWDITVQTSGGKAYSWLEVDRAGATFPGRFVGTVGSARPVPQIAFSQGIVRFQVPRQYEDHDLVFQGKLSPDGLAGTVTGYDRDACPWTARRAPALRRDHAPVWGKPVALFNGRDLAGWIPMGGENHWTVKEGNLADTGSGANLVTTRKFKDFRLHIEFRYPADSNSGIYLRGRYEVQIEDDEGARPSRYSNGSIYGFLSPSKDASKKPGEWQTYDITLVGRVVNVVFNGETVIDRQTIPGITGGALDADEGRPGPIMLQGDHGAIDFRNIVVTPAK